MSTPYTVESRSSHVEVGFYLDSEWKRVKTVETFDEGYEFINYLNGGQGAPLKRTRPKFLVKGTVSYK